MKLFTRRRPTDVKAALGISVDEVRKQGEAAIGLALGVNDAPPVLPPVAASPPATRITSDPEGHLKFAQRAVTRMDEEEARILDWISEKSAAHEGVIASLESELAGVRKTRAFYQAAPGFLATETTEPGDDQSTPVVHRPARRSQPKDQTNE